jgi:hypothetical protein
MSEQDPDFNESAHARAAALSQPEYVQRRRSHNYIATRKIEFSPLPRAPVVRSNTAAGMGALYRTISATSSCTSEITNSVDKCRKWLVLWWRVTFAPFFWKDELVTLAWGKKALEAKIDAAQSKRATRLEREGRWGGLEPGIRESSGEWSFMRRFPSASPSPSRPLSRAARSGHLRDGSSLGFTSRLAQPKLQLTEAEPRRSLQELLEDNVVSGQPSTRHSKTQSLANVTGWIGRSSISLDGVSLPSPGCMEKKWQQGGVPFHRWRAKLHIRIAF